MISVLHLVNYRLSSVETVNRCFGRMAADDCVLLIENGVYTVKAGNAISSELEKRFAKFAVKVLQPDLEARGIDQSEVIGGIDVIDDVGFVDLSITHGPVVSWFDS